MGRRKVIEASKRHSVENGCSIHIVDDLWIVTLWTFKLFSRGNEQNVVCMSDLIGQESRKGMVNRIVFEMGLLIVFPR